LLIPSADPGYDWIFSQGIAGFITMYGGVNSHMAIRAAELNIPAVIGAGESLFAEWTKASQLEVDCANRQVKVLR
jgi:phosphoenolpyruvate-protein kinase (PTS system EI component)